MNFDAENDDVTIMYPLLVLIFVGQYDNTGVQLVHNFLIYATLQQSTQAIVLTGKSVECGEHDFSSKYITPSATLRMNLIKTPG